MVNDEGMPRFFLAVSVIVLIPPSLTRVIDLAYAAFPCRAHRMGKIVTKEPLGARSDALRADRQIAPT
ncbi:hypothetical protein COLINT_02133 [Collinsella intestinalis DSM 13280]|uniref:Uncharacterized protein n=1 Tax=Collinsella intestinalis DSM 13280 TaxID=521003 RepID=C4F7W7_9ACTN|nr:hypothetical protein COLINT_02133 [Collinsella intestinalis DSM 13280]